MRCKLKITLFLVLVLTITTFSQSKLTIHGYLNQADWQKMIFSGRQIPPPENENDLEVINYVKEHAGAVGYVSSRAVINQVKKIKVVEEYR